MEGVRKELVEQTVQMLADHGFDASDLDLAGLTAYDIIARSKEEKYVIKVLYNIDTLRSEVAQEILRIAKLIGAAALVVGRRSSVGDLESGIMYFRHSVPMLSIETFSDYLDGSKPFVFSGPGGYYVPIDGQRMHKIRVEQGLSIGYVSSKIGISRRSVSLYESGSAATIDVIRKLEHLLAYQVRQEMDLISITKSSVLENTGFETMDIFLREVVGLLENVGYNIYPTKKTPYDAVACEDESFLFTLGAIRTMKEEINRIDAIVKASKAMDREFLLVSEFEAADRESDQNIVTIGELKDSCNQRDVKSLLEKNRSPS